MATIDAEANPFVVLEGVSWDTYEAITDTLAEFHLRHTYVSGRLELRRTLYGVPWETYKQFLAAIGDYHARHVYDEGTLQFMSPLKSHDWIKRLISRMIETMAYELHIPIQSIGSTTIYRDDIEKGFEGDEAYYVAHEPDVGNRDEYDPEHDPPPDLVLEIDVTSDSSERLGTFAALGVPEVWRHDGDELHFLARMRGGKKYRGIRASLAFPWLAPEDLTRFLSRRSELREDGVVRGFVRHAKKLKTAYDKQAKSN